MQFSFPLWFAASKLNYNTSSSVYIIWGRYPVGMSAGWSETSQLIVQDASSLGIILNTSTRRVLGPKILFRRPSANVRPNRRWKNVPGFQHLLITLGVVSYFTFCKYYLKLMKLRIMLKPYVTTECTNRSAFKGILMGTFSARSTEPGRSMCFSSNQSSGVEALEYVAVVIFTRTKCTCILTSFVP